MLELEAWCQAILELVVHVPYRPQVPNEGGTSLLRSTLR